MASLDFTTASSQYVSRGSFTALQGIQKLTMAAWMRRKATTDYSILGVFKATNDNSHRLSLYWHPTGSGRLYFGVGNGGGTWGHVANTSAAVWRHIAMVFDGTGATYADRLKGYVDGVQQTLSFNGIIPTVSSSSIDTLDNRHSTAAIYPDAQHAHFQAWSRALSDDEIVEIMWRPGALPDSLEVWSPMINAEDPVPDWSGNGRTLTLTNTPVNSDYGPPVSIGRTRTYFIPAAVVGGANPKGPLGHPLHGPFAGPVGP